MPKKPATCHPELPEEAKGFCHACNNRRYRLAHPRQDAEQHLDWRQKNPRAYLLGMARQRAKRKGFECTIMVNDIVIPEVCPILGLKLENNFGNNLYGVKATDVSPSIDRIDSTLGYVPGNIAVISFRANQIKNKGTAEEHRKIADWMKKLEES